MMTKPRAFFRFPWGCRVAAVCVAAGWPGPGPLQAAQTVRVVCYNVEADVDGVTAPRDGLATVLEAIGEQPYAGTAAQPLDVLALEETTSNGVVPAYPYSAGATATGTVAPIVMALNTYYGANIYALVPYQATEYGGPGTGNGPNALIYNTRTLTLVYQNGAAAVGVAGTAARSGGNTVYRQVPRYEFQPVEGAAGTSFYVYVTHMKSGTSTTPTNANDRTAEAQAIRADAATLPADASVLYMGDFNLDGSTEAAYQTMTATSTATGQGIDPANYPPDYTITWGKAAYKPILTQSTTSLDYRDDIQFMTPNVYGGTGTGLRYVAASVRPFGNNGTTSIGASTDNSKNTSLDTLQGPITASAALPALVSGSDHLPVVADYLAPTPYEAWQSGYFTAAELSNAAVSGDLADPDGDGVANLLEYALGSNPRVAGVVGLPGGGTVTVGGSQYLTLSYPQVIAATDLVYTPQVSGDLATWSAGAGNVVVVSTTNNADGVTRTIVVRDATVMGSGGRRFMRLLVTRP